MLAVYDDTNTISEIIRDIIGDKGFADVVVKRRHLVDYFTDTIRKEYAEATCRVVHSGYELAELGEQLEKHAGASGRVLHFFSRYMLVDQNLAGLTLAKLKYIEDDYQLTWNGQAVGAMFASEESYVRFLDGLAGKSTAEAIATVGLANGNVIPMDGIADIGVINHFIQVITGNFDSRYFNSLHGDDYTIVKSSTDKRKMKAEYTYYHLLPEDMQSWFVLPYNYTETDGGASYTMERLHMTDLAIKWVHGSINMEEFSMILDKYFYFFGLRHQKEVSAEEYRNLSDNLYEKKVVQRIEQLKQHKDYSKIAGLMASSCEDATIDDLLARYLQLKKKIEAGKVQKAMSVIGHGDPCFSNALYNKSTRTLKFIDPKGALTEEELWTNPYYDIAKLSHSICGRYDFFNNALFDIKINGDFKSELVIDFDNSKYMEAFRKKLEKNGYDYTLVRLYEASLFISMLPLHMDNPHKVFGFILNAEDILNELENLEE